MTGSVVIFGGRGQLGRDLTALLAPRAEVAVADMPECDITLPGVAGGFIRKHSPALVINAAAYTDVEKAEDEPDAARRANEEGARRVAEAAAEAGVPVVYYSTDFVFDGASEAPYAEDAPTAPLSVYGRTKLLGEEATRAANPRHYILRTAWLYGPGGNNFVEKIIRAAQQRPELRVVLDEEGSPTHTWDLAQATLALADSGKHGLYHVVNTGCCSRFEFARTILEMAGSATPVRPCAAAEMPMKAKRPPRAVLDTAKYTEATGLTPRPWRDALAHYFERRETRP